MIVRDIETGEVYSINTLETAVGQGATSKVWRAKNQAPQKPDVAIKIAFRGTSAEDLRAFWSERDVIKRIQEAGASHNVPWVHKGQVDEDPDAASLIMEWVSENFQLTRIAQESGGRLPEDMAVEAALQYASLLVALHQANLASLGDRKATDLRWAPNRRLVVLDWNRAQMIPDDGESTRRVELIRQDLRVFGQLWAVLLLGRNVSSLPPVDDTSDPYWATLSRWLKTILHKSLNSRPNWGYQKAEQLVADLGSLVQWRQNLVQGARTLDSEVRKLREAASSTRDPGEIARHAEAILNLADLERSHPSPMLQEARDWALQHQSAAPQIALEAIENMKEPLSFGWHKRAEEVAVQALEQLQGAAPDSQSAALRVNRWLLIAQLGTDADQAGLPIEPAVESLQKAVVQLENASQAPHNSGQTRPALEQAQAILRQAERNIPTSVASRIEPLRLEIEIRTALLSSRVASPMRAGQPDPYTVRAIEQWKQLETEHGLYAARLRIDLDLLDIALERTEADSERSSETSLASNNWDKAFKDILSSFKSANSSAWPDLSSLLSTAHTAYVTLANISTTARQEEKGRFEFVSRLEEVNRFMAAGEHVTALAHLDAIPVPPIASEHRRLAQQRAEAVALNRVRELSERGRWKDELDSAQQLLTALRQTRAVSSISKEARTLDKRMDLWRALRDRLPGGTAEYSGVNYLLDRPHDDNIDEVLREAQDEGLELFDRTGLSPEQSARCQVGALLAARATARLVGGVRNLASDLGTLRDALENNKASLEKTLQQAEKQREQLEEVAQEWKTLDLSAELDKWTQELDRLREKKEELGTAVGIQIPLMRDLATQLREAMDQLKTASSAINLSTYRAKVQETTQLKDQLVSHKASLDSSLHTAYRAVVYLKVQSGLQAVRRLELNPAQQRLSEVQRLKEKLAYSDTDINTAVNSLNESVEWLTQIDQYPQLSYSLRQWASALYNGNLQKAMDARFQFRQAILSDSNPTIPQNQISSSWVLGELESDLLAVRAPLSGSKIVITEPGELSRKEVQNLLRELDQIYQPSAERNAQQMLHEIEMVLKQLMEARGLSPNEILLIQRSHERYDSLRQQVNRVLACIQEWQELNEQLRQSPYLLEHPKLHTLAARTLDIVHENPAISPTDQQALCTAIREAAELSKKDPIDGLSYISIGLVLRRVCNQTNSGTQQSTGQHLQVTGMS